MATLCSQCNNIYTEEKSGICITCQYKKASKDYDELFNKNQKENPKK